MPYPGYPRNTLKRRKNIKVLIKRATAGYKKGEYAILVQDNRPEYDDATIVSKNGGHLNVSWNYLQKAEFTMEELIKEKKELEKEIKEINNKINWMKETGSDKFSYNEFRIHSILKELKDKESSDFEKAKTISKILDE